MNTQEITLIVYALPDKRRWIICEHSRIAADEVVELFLRADLSSYAPPSLCPTEAGLYRIEARAHVQKDRWGGCRLEVLSHAKLCGSLGDFLAIESSEKDG